MTEQNNDGVYLLCNIKSGYMVAYNNFNDATAALEDIVIRPKKPGKTIQFATAIDDWKVMAMSYGTANNFITSNPDTSYKITIV